MSQAEIYTLIKWKWRSSIIKKEEFLKAGSLFLIKNDAETLKYLGIHMQSPASLMLLPYICLCCNEALNYLEYNFEPNQLSQSPFIHKQVRNKLKLFSDRYGKSIKQIKLVDSQQNEEFKEKLRFKWLQSKNMHYNLGIYCNSEGHIVGNTQFVSFLLQNPSFTLKEENSHNIYEFAIFLGSALQMISQDLNSFEPEIFIHKNEISMDWLYKDYNTDKNFNCFPHIQDGKEITLLLLHLLSTINFVRYELPRYIDSKNPWLLRTQYITAYYVNESLKRLGKIEIPLKSVLIEEVDDRAVFDSSFRSCMIHYGFYNKGLCAVKDEHLLQNPYFGVIESCFEGKSYEEYQQLLVKKIFSLSKTLGTILSITGSPIYPPFT